MSGYAGCIGEGSTPHGMQVTRHRALGAMLLKDGQLPL